MNSSSAYSNVLLAAPVQPQSAPMPKRDIQDDQASDAFQQTFKDVHEAKHNEKAIKPVSSKKSVTAEKPSSENSVEQNATPANQLDKNRSRESVDKNETADQDKVSLKDASVSDQNATTGENKDDDLTSKPDATIALNQAQPLPEALFATTAPTTTLSNTAEASLAITTSTSNSSILTANAADALPLSDKGISAEDVVANELPKTQAAIADNDQPLIDGAALASDIRVQATQVAVVPQVPDSGVDAATQQSQALLASGTPLGNAASKPLITQSSLASESSSSIENPDALAIEESVDSELGASKTTGKLEVSASNKLVAETTLVSNQSVDSKTSFEKTLQNLTRSEAAASEQFSSSSATTQSSSTSTTNTLDSLFRLNDAQTPAARSFVVQTAVPVPVGQPQWSQAVGERVLWLAAQNVTSAEIHLHPKDLGPMQVNVSVNQEQASVTFTSHHAVVRDVLDQNINRLRDMFSEQGLNLVNVDVSDKSFSRQQGEAKDQHGQPLNKDGHIEDDAPVAVSAIIQQRLVDHYA